jgi:hypothetical protein
MDDSEWQQHNDKKREELIAQGKSAMDISTKAQLEVSSR